jgi:integrase
MNKFPDYPGVTSYQDRHGHTRYRYRRGTLTRTIPGVPGTPDFDAAYQAVIEGRASAPATNVVRHPRSAAPRSLAAAWRAVTSSPEWRVLDDATRRKNTYLAEAFLTSRVVPDQPITWADVPIAEIKRRHIKMILGRHVDTPHKAKHLLVTIRKMIYAAIDEEWIEHDPTTRINWRPQYTGWRAWTRDEITAYLNHWPPGTSARTVFSIALWLGLRRSDIPALQWDQIDFAGQKVRVAITKGGTAATLKLSPMLIADLTAAPRRGPFVVTNEYGKQWSEKSLTGRMAEWTAAAGLDPGCTLHGLRKTLGKLAAEGGATTRQSMDLLAHKNIAHAELYSREADQERMAAAALDRAVEAFDQAVKKG